ncbi:cyclopropane-fatty-acyl-phospholipid synthase [Corallococcus coralloides DSM 2259]|uniref:Cyclopropane-fatty-acyl-phospholipid synthase n=1 Tax=Corallococcus coralloides (strain ATCC 25202 / DSM 2259 / NBRC 100086 / M2) TaxID=1144275 RepID=H8MRD3_CORCM|nr:class I SAM-dependent methyltransferase [Corallococcus coralloides]AFE08297.1 cyclopropane-fatty-acyl-phospholipid synthase [Corallococcus coralloides DSM 2259]
MSTSTSRATGASAEAIQQHYDVSNAFYELWLDPGMTYSAALWLREEDDLDAAQRAKLDWHLDNLRIESAPRILDVGCGWGSMMRRALERNPDCRAQGLTLSQAQADRIQAQPSERISVALQSWAEHSVAEPYDGIVSVGAFEHFARLDQKLEDKIAGYRSFFDFCHRSLKPGGRLSLQTISYETAERKDFSKFFAEEIFPESDLPHIAEIEQASRHLFEIVHLRNDRTHYARTLRHWLRNLRARKAEARAMVGDAVYERYEKYLGMMVVAFHTGTMNLTRICFQRLDDARPRALAG